MISASDLRKITRPLNSCHDAELQSLEKDLKKAAEDGARSLTVKELSKESYLTLSTHGYEISRERRPNGLITISW